MSTLAPHIKVIRALALQAAEMGAGSARWHDWFNEMAWVLKKAADQLEAEDKGPALPLGDKPVHYEKAKK